MVKRLVCQEQEPGNNGSQNNKTTNQKPASALEQFVRDSLSSMFTMHELIVRPLSTHRSSQIETNATTQTSPDGREASTDFGGP